MPTPQGLDPNDVAWRVSSRTGSGHGNCVEAGPVMDGSRRVAVRHSYYPGERVIACDGSEWDTFLASVKSGRFDF